MKKHFSAVLLIILLVVLPIPKAGMMVLGLPIWFVLTALMLCSSIGTLRIAQAQSKQLPWLIVLGAFILVWLSQLLLLPQLLPWARFFSVDDVPLAITQLAPFSASNPLRSLSMLGFFICAWSACYISSNLSRQQLNGVLWAVLGVSLLQSVFGLWHFLSGQVSVLGLWDKEHYVRDVTGTFVNRNHYAGFLAICWPLVLNALLASKPLLLTKMNHSIRLLAAIFYSLIILLALVSSHSRMGTAAGLFAVLVWWCLYLHYQSQRASRKQLGSSQYSYSQKYTRSYSARYRKALPYCLGLLFVLFIIWFGVEDIIERYLILENGDSRFVAWSALFELPSAAFWFGIGPGTFADVFALVQPNHYLTRFQYAHNDYLEFIIEFGLLGSGVMVLALCYWFWQIFPRGNLALRAGAFASITAMALHSLVDFTLQVPASALYFWVAVGLLMNPVLNQQQRA